MKLFFLSIFLLALLSFLLVLICPSFSGGICSLVSGNYLVLGTAAIHVGILSLSLFLLWKGSLASTLAGIGVPGNLKMNLVFTVLCLFAMFIVSFIVGLSSFYLGFNDQEKIAEKIAGLPVLMLVAAAVLAPIGEELFFRASLVPRIGPILSSLVFGVVHLTYGSVVEVVGVVLLGVVLAVTYQKAKSLTPCILAHMTYNAISIAVMLAFRGLA